MADKKISELDLVAAANITGAEVLPIVQTETTKKTSLYEVQHFIVNHLEPTTLTVSDGNTYDLGDSTYDEAELIVLSWSGGNGTATLTLPDVTESKNLNRTKRIITDSTFSNSTHANITPYDTQNLDGANSSFDLNRAYEGIKIWGNGTEWFIIQQKA
tara:strand:+ start:11164 stop:11637 length:474 start_codon:yes stop_codon:yes gene_type:complete